MTRRPRALLVTPLLPALGGNGLAMRTGVFLDALAADHDVTLLVVPVAGGGAPGPFVLERARHLALLPLAGALDPLFALGAAVADPDRRLAARRDYPRPHLCRWATSVARTAAGAAVGAAADGAADFDTVVVVRSYLAPYAAPFLDRPAGGTAPFLVLDLDDDEILTQRRLHDLYERRGAAGDALLAAAEAAKYELHERAWLPRFDLLLATSDDHAARVAERHPACRVAVVPNTVAVPDVVHRIERSPDAAHRIERSPDAVHRAERSPAALRLLFVGNLSYEPNVDAARWLAEEILPRLRTDAGTGASDHAVELRLAGAAPTPAVAALAAPGIEICPDPADLAPHYAWADLALAPIRAGGGTRIKILEAFAVGVPVVATPLGAEGLAVSDGEHLLLATDAAGLADACRRLADAPATATRLAANAFALVRARYSRPHGLHLIRTLCAAAPPPEQRPQ